jgi:hypothetical protein
MIELPNKSNPFEIPPKTKYLIDASIATRLWYVFAVKAYSDKLTPSRAKYAPNKSKADNKNKEKKRKKNIGIYISAEVGLSQINFNSAKIIIKIKKKIIKNLQKKEYRSAVKQE